MRCSPRDTEAGYTQPTGPWFPGRAAGNGIGRTCKVTAAGWIAEGNRIAFELDARVDGYDAVQYAMDHLTVAADGKHIGRMALYYRQVSR